jgi:hypothetical protein
LAQGTTRGVPIDTDPLLTADSDLLVPSQKAIKAYADTKGDMKLAFVQTNLGAKTFLDTTFLLRNVANTFNASFTNTNTADRIYTLPDTAGTIALTSNLTGYVPYTGATADLLMGIRRVGINSTDFGSGGHTFQLSVGGNIKASRIYSNIFRDETSGNTWVSVTGTAPNQVLALGNSSITSITNVQTWNNVATVYTALDINITDTNSASSSMFLNLRTGGTSQLSISKFGQFTVANNPAIIHGSGVFTVVHGGVQHIRSSNSGTLIGTGGNATARLEVRSASAVSGTAFLVQNSTPTDLFTVLNVGNVGIGYATPTAKLSIGNDSGYNGALYVGNVGTTSGRIALIGNMEIVTNGNPSWTGQGFSIAGASRTFDFLAAYNNVTDDNLFMLRTGSNAGAFGNPTLGSKNFLSIGMASGVNRTTFAPTSGNAAYTVLYLTSAINQTGGANGTIRGIYYNPTITALGGIHNAWESTSGRIIATDTGVTSYSFATTYAGAANSNQGAFYIVSNGNLNNLMLTSNSGTYATTNYAGIGFMVVHSTLGQALTVRLRSRYYDTSNATLEFSTNRGAVNPTFAGKFHGDMFAVGDFEYSAPTATIHAKGNSASTGNAFLVQNSTPSDLFKVENSGKIFLKGNTCYIDYTPTGNIPILFSKFIVGDFSANNLPNSRFSVESNYSYAGSYTNGIGVFSNNSNTGTTMHYYATGTVNNSNGVGTLIGYRANFGNSSTTNTWNSVIGVSVGGTLSSTFTTASGNITGFLFDLTINQVGNLGTARGVYLAPILTAVPNYIAIEATSRNSANDTLLKLSNNTRDVLCVKGDNKIGLFNATPTIQGTTAMAAATYTNNGSIDLDTFDGYTIGQVVVQLRNMGILS